MSCRKMPTANAIRAYWESKDDGPDFVIAKNICMVCGFQGNERCHIQAKSDGGPDTVENLNVLCSECHMLSEGYSGEQYWGWVEYMLDMDLIQHTARKMAKHGLSMVKMQAFANECPLTFGMIFERMPELHPWGIKREFDSIGVDVSI